MRELIFYIALLLLVIVSEIQGAYRNKLKSCDANFTRVELSAKELARIFNLHVEIIACNARGPMRELDIEFKNNSF